MSILFRKIKQEDLELIRNWRMSPEVTKYMYTDPVLTIKDQLQWFEKVSNDETRRDWIININNLDLGLLSITNINKINKRCEWAYYLGLTKMRGKGIGKNVELNMQYYVFETLNLNKVCCEVLLFNEKVIDIHKKYGFFIEGIRKQHILKNDCFYDIVEMAILKEDWENNIKGQFQFEKGYFEE